jgi:hypothetical protein
MPWLTRETGYAITDPKDYLVREFLFLLPLSSTKLGMGLEDRTARSTILYSTSTQAYSIPLQNFQLTKYELEPLADDRVTVAVECCGVCGSVSWLNVLSIECTVTDN